MSFPASIVDENFPGNHFLKMKNHKAPTNLSDLLRLRAEHNGDGPAYTFLSDGERDEITWSYRELDRQARIVAARLQEDEAAGKRVLLIFPAGLQFIAAFWGCLYAGAVPVPAYPPRANHNLLRLQAIVADCEASFALTIGKIFRRIQPMIEADCRLNGIRWIVTNELEEDLAVRWRRPDIAPESMALLQYTSGSTSLPRGVMVSHANLLDNEARIQEAFRLSESSIIAGWLPLYHDMGLIGNMLQPLYAGGRCILMSPVAFLQRPGRWLSAISRYRATVSGGPNFAYDLCARKIADTEIDALDLSCWEVAFNGAEPVRAETLDRFADRFERAGFRRSAWCACYGLAEATLLVSGKVVDEGPVVLDLDADALANHRVEAAVAQGRAQKLVSCGDIDRQQVLIVNPDSRMICADGQVGEIWISGGSVAQGYWNRPEENESLFHARTVDHTDGTFLRSGDLGFVVDGRLYVTGRIKDLIIIRGRNHYPQDLERTVENTHAGMRRGSGAAFSIEVQGQEALVIVQEIEHVQWEDHARLADAVCAALVEEHEVRPFAVSFIRAGTAPKTSSGKIQRHLCRRLFLDGELRKVFEWRSGIPGDDALQESLSTFRPEASDDWEQWLVSELAARAGVAAASIDLSSSPARYGLDSLGAIEVAHSAERQTGVALPLAVFLRAGSIRELAAELFKCAATTIGAVPSSPSGTVELPLSLGQRSLWLEHELAPESDAYNLCFAACIREEVDVASLAEVFQLLHDHHPSLRTTFHSSEAGPFYRIHSGTQVSFRLVDASALSAQSLRAEMETESHFRFDLERGPLFRVSLFRRSSREHYLLLLFHHVIADMWSIALLTDQFTRLYRAARERRSELISTPSSNYAEYVEWQRQMLLNPEGEALRRYWGAQFAGELPVLDLPVDRPHSSPRTFHGAASMQQLDGDLVEKLRLVAAENKATLFMLLLAAFQILLGRYSGQHEVLVGSPTTGRERARWDEVFGYFVNPVVLRSSLRGEPEFSVFLSQVRTTVLGAFEHQAYPLFSLLEQLRPQRRAGRSSLFEVMFAFEKTSRLDQQGIGSFVLETGQESVVINGMTLSPVALGSRSALFDLTLIVAEAKGGLAVSFQYNVDLFAQSTIDRMAGHWRELLRGIAAGPRTRVGELPLVSAAERRQITEHWNPAGHALPPGCLVPARFEGQCERTPQGLALVCGDESITYRELDRRANQMAHYLRGAGVAADQVVAIYFRRNIEMIVSMLAVLKAGGCYMPLDPQHPSERLRCMIADAGAAIVVCERALLDDLPESAARVVCVEDELEEIGRLPKSSPVVPRYPAALAYIIYTSGSTGTPRGVEVSHGALANLVHWHIDHYRLAAHDRMTQYASVGFDAAVWEIWPALASGASLHIVEEELRLETERLVPWLGDAGITVSFLPTPVAEMALKLNWGEGARLRFLLTGGDRLHQVPPDSFPFRTINHYGPTENTVVATACSVGPEDGPCPPIGRPITNIQAYILNGQMELAPAGITGELFLGGAGLARGYRGRPELTAEKFVPNPFGVEAGGRLYRTGDLARYRDDGVLEYIGRADQQIKIRGYRIELGEVESVLASHPSVTDAVVTASGDSSGEKRLVGYVVLEAVGRPSKRELREYLKEKLPDYMVPAVIMTLSELPVTTNGKVDRHALPLPDLAEADGGQEYVAPQPGIEELLAQIWGAVLRVDRVGARDNFFDLGGHSLAATQLAARIRNAFQIELTLREVFTNPELGRQAEVIGQRMRGGAQPQQEPVRRAPEAERRQLSYAQQRMWFLDQLEPDSAIYNLPGAVLLQGALDVPALKGALNEVVRRHEVLRTCFEMGLDGTPLQAVRPEMEPEIAFDEFDAGAFDVAEEQIRSLAGCEARRPFDLAHGPLVRSRIVKTGPEEHLLLLTLHHIVADGWSMGILMRELGEIYSARLSGRDAGLPDLPVQYADYAAWQRRWPAEEMQVQLNYWRTRLQGMSSVLELPTDFPRPPQQTYRGAQFAVHIDPELEAALKRLARSETATLFVVLLAGLQVLLAKYSGQNDVAVGAPIANRNRPEIEDLIGFFANTLVLRGEIGPQDSFRLFLRQVLESALGAYAHQDLPFEKLVEDLMSQRDLSRSPLFQVMFGFQNTPGEDLQFPGIKHRFLSVDTQTAKFDLTLLMLEKDAELHGVLEYNADLFMVGTIERMVSHWKELLRGIATRPDARVGELSYLTSTERARILEAWNDTQRTYPSETLADLMEAQAERTPEAVAVIGQGRQLTYFELNQRANQLAHHLRKKGVGPEVIVGVCMERGVEAIVALMAVLKTGGAYVALDPRYPAERLVYMSSDSGARLVLTDQSNINKVPAFNAEELCVDLLQDDLTGNPPGNLSSDAGGESLAYLIYTSGSTGRPKAVMVTRKAATTLCRWAHEVFRPEELRGVLASTSFCFDLSVFELFVPLSCGGAVVIVNDLLALIDSPYRDLVTLINTVPSAMEELLRMRGLPPSVMTVNLAGETLTSDLVRKIYDIGTIARVCNLYGPSEDTTYSTYASVQPGDKPPIGRSIANSQAYVIDRQMEPVGIGVTGEIFLGGAGLARGYLGRPELTAEMFLPDPFSAQAGGRLYRTGDLGRYRETGVLEYLGRADHQIKLRGFRIELGEIESALRSHSGVREAVAVVRGEAAEEKRLAAYVVLEAPGVVDIRELKEYLRGKLPEYMVPGVIAELPSMPLTANGKADRKALPDPLGPESSARQEYAAPRNETEEILSQIWSEVLKVQRVGVRDNFFSLGGHSLLATQMVARIRDAFHVEIKLRTFFERPTIEDIARYIVDSPALEVLPELVPVSREAFRVCTPMDESMVLPEILRQS